LGHIKTVCIGPATANKLFEFGIRSDIVPDSFQAESIIDAFKNKDIKNKRFLIPRAEEARTILPDELKNMGATVDEIAVYKTIPVTKNKEELIKLLEEKKIDMVTFTSSSTVKNFTSLIPQDKLNFLMDGLSIACIGPITADTAKSLGYTVDITAKNFTIPGLCEAFLEHYRNLNIERGL
jgi:uroporphyrinogen III methyltransferase/synthase